MGALPAQLTYVRPILEYGSVVWSPYKTGDISCIEKVQRSFTKRLPGLKNFTYRNRLAVTNLETLESRRLRADLVMCYKIVFSVINVDFGTFFRFVPSSIIGTRGHRYCLLNSLITMYVIIFLVDVLSILGITYQLILIFHLLLGLKLY